MNRTIRLSMCLATFLVASGTVPPMAVAQTTTSGPYGQDASQYSLAFYEDFANGFNTRIWNDHIWYEASNPTKNYTVSYGSLKIWPQRDANGRFFNRTIDTDGKYYQQYGYFEIEAKLPKGKGTWPAFWLFSHSTSTRPELDMMKAFPGATGWGTKDSSGVLHPTAYGVTAWTNTGVQAGGNWFGTVDLSAAFHKYGMKWEANKVTYYFDGKPMYSVNVSLSTPMYLLLDLWFGGPSGTPDWSTPTGQGNSLVVNYVRTWKFAPAPAPAPAPSPSPTPYGQDASLYSLSFSDEFESGFNTGVWNDHTWYEKSNPTINYGVENGELKIWPQRDASGNFFNRTIDTDGKYYQTYGYFEMEAKLPVGKGTWPAFWLLNHIDTHRPEIDIMEAYAGGAYPWGQTINGQPHPTAFGTTVWTDAGVKAGFKQNATPDLSAAFHKYGMKWEPTKITFYFDGTAVHTLNVSMSSPMYILVDLWFGSASGTPDSTTPTGKANSFEINYVRAWKFK